MVQAGIVLKVPRGSPVPQGYTYVRSLRTMNVYKKNAAAPVPQAQINELEEMFARMGVNARLEPVDDLEKALAGLMMGGRKRTTRKHARTSKTRKSRSRK